MRSALTHSATPAEPLPHQCDPRHKQTALPGYWRSLKPQGPCRSWTESPVSHSGRRGFLRFPGYETGTDGPIPAGCGGRRSPYTPRMPTSPGPLLEALDALWERLRADVPELPPIRPTVSPTSRMYDHGPERWGLDGDVVTGLVVNADVLAAGAETFVVTVLHDAAHILNWRRDVKDLTVRGSYHNQSFLTTAEEVGLEWEEGAARSANRGFDSFVLSDEARRRHEPDLKALERAIPLTLPHLTLPATKSRVDRLTLRCKCTPSRSFRISQTVAALGPIVCGVCGKPFTEE